MRKAKFWDLIYKQWVDPLDAINYLWKTNHKTKEVVLDDGIQEECKVLLFTGLMDKNGREIYEGDVVALDGKKYEVAFGSYFSKTDVGHGVHLCENGDKNAHPKTVCNMDKDYEIIGNIWENPDLI